MIPVHSAAFPTGHGDGMTLREYYAGQALSGLLSQSHPVSAMVAWDDADKDPKRWHEAFISYIAPRCVEMADALISELQK